MAMTPTSALGQLRKFGSFDVRTPAVGRPILRTTVYIDGDVMTTFGRSAIDQATADSHFGEVVRLGGAMAAQLRILVASLWVVGLSIGATSCLLMRLSWVLMAEVTIGITLSTIVDRAHRLRLWLGGLGDPLMAGVPAALAIVTWRLGLAELPIGLTIVALWNLAVVLVWTSLRWLIGSEVKVLARIRG